MKIIPKDQVNLTEIAQVLRSGGLVVFPTETLYGIGAEATNPEAVARLNAYKQRPLGKPYSIAVTDMAMAEEYVELNATARNLYHNFLPGPLTVISTGRHKVASGVESETGTLGVRIPAYPLVLNLVRLLGKPITATSANASYQKRPYKIADILDNISAKQQALIDVIIDAGELPRNEPSTVVDTTLDNPVSLRIGEIKFSDTNTLFSSSEENTKNIAKELWQKYSHYQGQRAIVFALEGPMGAGKTQFTKGLARAMGLAESEVTSPTYALHEDYGPLQHIDTWRMENAEELQAIGWGEMITDKSVIALEWADKVAELVRARQEDAIIIWAKIAYGDKDTERTITWSAL